MTREEAIESLRHCASEDKCPDGIVGNCYGCNRRIALNMAIEALSAEPKDILKSIPTVELLEELGVASVEELMEEPLSHEEAWAEIESDLISRADAVKAWEELSVRGRTEFDQVLMTLPSAEAVGWIPCSERLPEIAHRCLVTLSNGIVCIGVLHSEGRYEDASHLLIKKWDKRWHLEPASMEIAFSKDSVIAWKPLPTPYKGGEDE